MPWLSAFAVTLLTPLIILKLDATAIFPCWLSTAASLPVAPPARTAAFVEFHRPGVLPSRLLCRTPSLCYGLCPLVALSSSLSALHCSSRLGKGSTWPVSLSRKTVLLTLPRDISPRARRY
ncbi:hypothetical protein PF005_g6969 [Phytophthora fragariae]|uniref:Secreted protein n=1 Tax=Phytophthora fragariae TaxID=53985 RepID=A0A6A3YQI9_9STRA|nr:hypothetical protein PF003_g23303 [Phytophthora fragariae]KAE8942613.1 hypothetical protein PF009_g7621 [Phytophthora fragariae]KAE9123346.1 hypothetical protein PF007_g7086 [Phytophthora fragariae]KAE9149383.1 hypothetical protein PF006_g6108 [Phytophthora fragariae]KAE9221761.1 hypothetical protein PF005_g6969 [Phytophthora fragariae]